MVFGIISENTRIQKVRTPDTRATDPDPNTCMA
jgi:hypothetical protein